MDDAAIQRREQPALRRASEIGLAHMIQIEVHFK
jgi:hypothetical protein